MKNLARKAALPPEYLVLIELLRKARTNYQINTVAGEFAAIAGAPSTEDRKGANSVMVRLRS